MGGPGSGPKKKGGRPTKLTDQLSGEICRLVRAGNYLETAAACCNVSTPTLRAWMKRGGKERSGPFNRFLIALKKAEAEAEASAIVRIRQAGKTLWTAEAWYLERKFPAKWGRWDRVTHEEKEVDVSEQRKLMQRKDVRDLLDEAARKLDMEGEPGSASE